MFIIFLSRWISIQQTHVGSPHHFFFFDTLHLFKLWVFKADGKVTKSLKISNCFSLTSSRNLQKLQSAKTHQKVQEEEKFFSVLMLALKMWYTKIFCQVITESNAGNHGPCILRLQNMWHISFLRKITKKNLLK